MTVNVMPLGQIRIEVPILCLGDLLGDDPRYVEMHNDSHITDRRNLSFDGAVFALQQTDARKLRGEVLDVDFAHGLEVEMRAKLQQRLLLVLGTRSKPPPRVHGTSREKLGNLTILHQLNLLCLIIKPPTIIEQ